MALLAKHCAQNASGADLLAAAGNIRVLRAIAYQTNSRGVEADHSGIGASICMAFQKRQAAARTSGNSGCPSA
jgi:hypothetical protein